MTCEEENVVAYTSSYITKKLYPPLYLDPNDKQHMFLQNKQRNACIDEVLKASSPVLFTTSKELENSFRILSAQGIHSEGIRAFIVRHLQDLQGSFCRGLVSEEEGEEEEREAATDEEKGKEEEKYEEEKEEEEEIEYLCRDQQII
ncbi:hypothetical protein PoB_005105600 [Plakobranchus ocellatus]|uniref:Uncharacterized protein n=1 Tax=Plakobranchus ocellatus TaxID=259542 RepID=A0AAV4BMN9_9GAST|nr:hypothetical protein PoB_005105600 [Plakobranchus ocellatus]